jgi:hypothetical protein
MTGGNTYAINKHLNDQEDYDALQEVTAELEQAEARIEELEAELAKAVELKTVKILVTSAYKEGWCDGSEGIALNEAWGKSLTCSTIAELKGEQ